MWGGVDIGGGWGGMVYIDYVESRKEEEGEWGREREEAKERQKGKETEKGRRGRCLKRFGLAQNRGGRHGLPV